MGGASKEGKADTKAVEGGGGRGSCRYRGGGKGEFTETVTEEGGTTPAPAAATAAALTAAVT